MQPTTGMQVGGLIPGRPSAGGAGRPVSSAQSDPGLNPAEHKLLDPPPKKVISSFRGVEASQSKNPLGDRLIGQNNDFTRGWTSNIMRSGMLHE